MFDEIIAPLVTTEWGRRAGWVTLICMLLLLVLTVINMIWEWHRDYVLVHNQPYKIASPLSANEMANRITQIPEQHIFGQYGLDQAALPVTSLQLHLVGVIKAESDTFSRVIISENGRPGKVYQVGDTLSSGVKINAITRDGVILDNGGRLEKLPLQRAPLLFQGMPKPLLPQNTEE